MVGRFILFHANHGVFGVNLPNKAADSMARARNKICYSSMRSAVFRTKALNRNRLHRRRHLTVERLESRAMLAAVTLPGIDWVFQEDQDGVYRISVWHRIGTVQEGITQPDPSIDITSVEAHVDAQKIDPSLTDGFMQLRARDTSQAERPIIGDSISFARVPGFYSGDLSLRAANPGQGGLVGALTGLNNDGPRIPTSSISAAADIRVGFGCQSTIIGICNLRSRGMARVSDVLITYEFPQAPDIIVSNATLNEEDRSVTFQYELKDYDGILPFNIGLYRSADDRFDFEGDGLVKDQLIQAEQFTASVTDGVQSHTFFGLGADDPDRPFLLVVADAPSQERRNGFIEEVDEGNNVAVVKQTVITIVDSNENVVEHVRVANLLAPDQLKEDGSPKPNFNKHLRDRFSIVVELPPESKGKTGVAKVETFRRDGTSLDMIDGIMLKKRDGKLVSQPLVLVGDLEDDEFGGHEGTKKDVTLQGQVGGKLKVTYTDSSGVKPPKAFDISKPSDIKKVVLNVTFLEPMVGWSEAIVETTIKNASALFAPADIFLEVKNARNDWAFESTPDFALFDERNGPSQKLQTLITVTGDTAPNVVNVYFVGGLLAKDENNLTITPLGLAYRHLDVALVANQTDHRTLAHELMHIIMDCRCHVTDDPLRIMHKTGDTEFNPRPLLLKRIHQDEVDMMKNSPLSQPVGTEGAVADVRTQPNGLEAAAIERPPNVLLPRDGELEAKLAGALQSSVPIHPKFALLPLDANPVDVVMKVEESDESLEFESLEEFLSEGWLENEMLNVTLLQAPRGTRFAVGVSGTGRDRRGDDAPGGDRENPGRRATASPGTGGRAACQAESADPWQTSR